MLPGWAEIAGTSCDHQHTFGVPGTFTVRKAAVLAYSAPENEPAKTVIVVAGGFIIETEYTEAQVEELLEPGPPA